MFELRGAGFQVGDQAGSNHVEAFIMSKERRALMMMGGGKSRSRGSKHAQQQSQGHRSHMGCMVGQWGGAGGIVVVGGVGVNKESVSEEKRRRQKMVVKR